MNKVILIILAVVVLVGAGAFYGGMKYGQNKSSFGNFSPQNLQNMSFEQRQQVFQGRIGREAGAGPEEVALRPYGANFLSGEVISKDEQNLTLKLPDGSSKIVFFSDSTQISKMADGSINDVEIGRQIMVTGEQNSDGSYTAKTIQLSFFRLAP